MTRGKDFWVRAPASGRGPRTRPGVIPQLVAIMAIEPDIPLVSGPLPLPGGAP